MGQKLNPTIFRLGVTKIWKTEFIEKKNCELPLYVFKDLEIKNYLERIFETNGIILHDYKQQYNASTLNLYISYFITPDFALGSKKSYEQLILKSRSGSRSVITKKSNRSFYALLASKITNTLLFENSSKFYKIKQYLKLNVYSQLFTQSFFVDLRETQDNKYFHPTLRQRSAHVGSFITQVFSVLNSFLGNQLNIVVNFCCVNKNVQFFKVSQKKTFISFQKFKNTPFFKEGIELLFNVVFNVNSASLLAKFVALQLKKAKRQKFFLSFLKQVLNVLLTSNLAKIKGVKIILKGRLNGVPRAKHKIIIVGDVPVQTISAKLDFSQTTVHNSNGSYGIKVWIVEK